MALLVLSKNSWKKGSTSCCATLEKAEKAPEVQYTPHARPHLPRPTTSPNPGQPMMRDEVPVSESAAFNVLSGFFHLLLSHAQCAAKVKPRKRPGGRGKHSPKKRTALRRPLFMSAL